MSHMIREISIKDVDEFVSLASKIYDESDYMVYNQGEYAPSKTDAIDHLEYFITSPANAIFVAEHNGELVGYTIVTTESLERTKHEAKVTLGVIRHYRERGLGRALINSVEAWCTNHQIRRIEVSVVPENTTAVDMFKDAGFKIEGELRDKLYIDDRYYNKYVMAKLLI
ncbi:GNAT family N-acetyltransferase [Staphylococcus auricularis]|uniref:GNAT family N-acetyltransferase n=1 Tax=Staphylococcus auricularis TaxID=29379 RepID=A0ABX5IDJ0_9STAP|nr:GNAT family N-acetyltransferase [Staphylococcus auricularis]MCE5038737.1 GNAT family N-acetyltransferase [Staphylococcus auricularis]MEB6570538.1 GNAT family N-acetyltransferase [Staphylococcus auricularis]PTH17650.1 GNAT family N-acetyltransferase [Staphylococcus auricularis]PTH25083.1 GNAT family N-acetyltransferase [Staphylococcus auricularis]